MNEIQQAFEKWAKDKTTEKVIGKYSLEPWHEDWIVQEANRNYASMTTEMDFRIFAAGWEARGKM